MNVDLQRAIDRYLGVPLCALASLLERVLPRRTPPSLPRRIVVILLSEMGSLVLAQPMFALLRARYPEASLHVLLFGKNREVLDLMASVPLKNYSSSIGSSKRRPLIRNVPFFQRSSA